MHLNKYEHGGEGGSLFRCQKAPEADYRRHAKRDHCPESDWKNWFPISLTKIPAQILRMNVDEVSPGVGQEGHFSLEVRL